MYHEWSNVDMIYAQILAGGKGTRMGERPDA